MNITLQFSQKVILKTWQDSGQICFDVHGLGSYSTLNLTKSEALIIAEALRLHALELK